MKRIVRVAYKEAEESKLARLILENQGLMKENQKLRKIKDHHAEKIKNQTETINSLMNKISALKEELTEEKIKRVRDVYNNSTKVDWTLSLSEPKEWYWQEQARNKMKSQFKKLR